MLTTQQLDRFDLSKMMKATMLCLTSLALILVIRPQRNAIAPPSQISKVSNETRLPNVVGLHAKDEFPSRSANILVIHSYHPELSWTQKEKTGIDQGFEKSHHSVTVYHEFLDAKRYPSLTHRQIFLKYLQTKYENTTLDVLMIADDPGLQMLLDEREDFFPTLPVVFMGINNVEENLLTIPWMTGVFETHSLVETLNIAQQQTGSEQIIVVSDSSETGRANRSRLETLSQDSDVEHSLVFVEDIASSAVDEILGPYPDDIPIFLAGQLRQDEEDGALISFEQEVQMLRSHLPNPIYTQAIMHIGHGAVGGKVLDGVYHAEQAVQLVAQILNGTPVSDIPPIVEAKNQWFFDVDQLDQINIAIEDLPSGSTLINEDHSFYKENRILVWTTLGIFSLGGLIILILANAIRLQKQAEAKLKDSEKQLEQRVCERTEELRNTLDDLKKTQAQLIQSEKSSSLGQLMGGIAHEFNNPLGFIAGNIGCLEEYTQNLIKLVHLYQFQTSPPTEAMQYSQDIDLNYIQEDIPKVLQSMNRGTERIQHLVETLNNFVRVNEEGFKPTNLLQSLDTTLLLLKSQIADDITITKDYTSLPLVYCNPGNLNQVFMSIVLNAIEALADSYSSPKQIHIKTLLLPDHWVRISIADTGSGIPPEYQSKIFDPFFTTKKVGEGMGMGLALCYQTIQQHQGRLTYQSTPGEGTTFFIDLPS